MFPFHFVSSFMQPVVPREFPDSVRSLSNVRTAGVFHTPDRAAPPSGETLVCRRLYLKHFSHVSSLSFL